MPKEKKVRGQHRVQPVHPNSRKAAQLTREAHKRDQKDKKKLERQNVIANQIAKLMWFRERIDESKKLYSQSEMTELVKVYLHRHDDELEKLLETQSEKKCLRSHYRLQFASREDSIRSAIVRERELFEGPGIEAPDLTSPKLFQVFLEWFGEEKLLSKIVLKNYRGVFANDDIEDIGEEPT